MCLNYALHGSHRKHGKGMARDASAVKETIRASETAITASDVQDHLGDVIDRAWAGERFRVTRHGRDRAYVIGINEFERLLKLAGIRRRRDPVAK